MSGDNATQSETKTSGTNVNKIVHKLADIIKDKRDDAFEQIQDFLKIHNNLSMVNCRKLWIGLLTGFWLTDKLVKQIAFAENIADLTSYIVSHEDKVTWWKAYMVEIRDHWKILDKWRLSKYYTLVRKMLFSMIDYMNNKEFNKKAHEIIDIIDKDMMGLQLFEAVPIQLHSVSIILTEIARLDKKPSGENIMSLLNPFINPILGSISFPVRKTVLKDVCYAAVDNEEFNFMPLNLFYKKMIELSKENEISQVFDTKPLNNFLLHLSEKVVVDQQDINTNDPLAAIEAELASIPETIVESTQDDKMEDEENDEQLPPKTKKRKRETAASDLETVSNSEPALQKQKSNDGSPRSVKFNEDIDVKEFSKKSKVEGNIPDQYASPTHSILKKTDFIPLIRDETQRRTRKRRVKQMITLSTAQKDKQKTKQPKNKAIAKMKKGKRRTKHKNRKRK